ncbi:tRNA (adenosine(37)-N6)-threonylcarbamoyltransferase complex dimerization subunit type 1 TsaB [Hyphomicrobium sp.]|uniref:tRNA (adenosine(37)-N6)-threonylcarbamoyltransferase complex dimerization subunit type 1 TsaB n=1 Tax=Hyphomicrobium sp. TaxID=82 RepID=UPI0025B9B270|nr:tRNA (adenosine(37)-N6)-threonylcarbamoyltransferase complex dimerization subunit type 1 TsaB [Hyphomicrobium sp.]MCC7252238.1 tRNA (adenosine(37)-N6)-threonylcarbamoyltransferase complex dimerization subunit type 1 TsaB [Hyphomicrobium sp.]
MNTLAFDTCFAACSVAATWRMPDGVAGAYRFERLERGHAERLTPMIGEAMSEAPFGFSDIGMIIVTTGPGTFTGQRVGIAAARALSLATGAPVGTLSSLAVMAYTAVAEIPDEVEGKVLAVAVDARRGEIYFQRFAGPAWSALGEPELVTPAAAADRLGASDAVVVGSGAEVVAEASRKVGGSVSARIVALEPDVRFIPDGAVRPGSVLPRPLYLRPPDAKPQDGASLGRVS